MRIFLNTCVKGEGIAPRHELLNTRTFRHMAIAWQRYQSNLPGVIDHRFPDPAATKDTWFKKQWGAQKVDSGAEIFWLFSPASQVADAATILCISLSDKLKM